MFLGDQRRSLAVEPVELILFSWSIYPVPWNRISHYNNGCDVELSIQPTEFLNIYVWFCSQHCSILCVPMFFLHSRISRGNFKCVEMISNNSLIEVCTRYKNTNLIFIGTIGSLMWCQIYLLHNLVDSNKC